MTLATLCPGTVAALNLAYQTDATFRISGYEIVIEARYGTVRIFQLDKQRRRALCIYPQHAVHRVLLYLTRERHRLIVMLKSKKGIDLGAAPTRAIALDDARAIARTLSCSFELIEDDDRDCFFRKRPPFVHPYETVPLSTAPPSPVFYPAYVPDAGLEGDEEITDVVARPEVSL